MDRTHLRGAAGRPPLRGRLRRRARSRLPAREPARGRRRLPACRGPGGRRVAGPGPRERGRLRVARRRPRRRRRRPRPSLACPVLHRAPPLADAGPRHATGSGSSFGEYKGVDDLPAEVLAPLEEALPRSLEPTELSRAARAATQAFLGELALRAPSSPTGSSPVSWRSSRPPCQNPPESRGNRLCCAGRPPQGTSGRSLQVATHEASRACKTRPSTRP